MQKRSRRRTSLDAWLNSVTTPVYLLDSRRRVRFFNTGCVRLTGWPTSEVLGRVCEYHTEDVGPEQFLGSICPPPEVFAGRGVSVPAYINHRDGREIACVQEFFPLLDEEGRVEGVLAVLSTLQAARKPPTPTAAQKLHAELAALRLSLKRRFALKTFIGRSSGMQRVLAQLHLARQSPASVWISGESGTGKEHLARIIHYESESQNLSFVPLDCRKTPAVDLKRAWKRLAEMAGEQGAVTSLHPGTVYLIDAAACPRDLQENIVAFLDEQEQHTDGRRLRLIAASASTSTELRGQDELLPEFLDRLTTIEITVPPLRQRPEDLRPLAQHLLENLNRGETKQLEGFSEDVWRLFEKYNWPGNVRELQTVIQEARERCEEPLIQEDHLPFRFRTGYTAQSEGPPVTAHFQPLEPFLENIEREHIVAALEQARDNKTRAAELLGIPRPRLYRRMEALGIEDRDSEPPAP